MTSDKQRCGLSSLIPMSCRGRAEAFARRLHSRLRSLGSHNENGSADESSWLAATENPIAMSQPRHSSDSDMFFDFGLLESPGSPEEEIEVSELHKLINKDNLKHMNGDECHCPKVNEKKNNIANNFSFASNDSDSDGSFYDTENDVDQRIMNHVNGDTNSESSKSQDTETGIDVSSQETSNQDDSFATTSDCTPQPSSSLSEDASTLSLRDEDYPSLEISESLTDISKCNNVDTDNDCINRDNGDNCEQATTNKDCKYNGNSGDECNQITTDKSCITVNGDLSEETYISTLNVEKDLTVECLSTSEKSINILTANNRNNVEIHVNNDDDDEADERIPRVRRCSSLKTGKTPPGTPGRKKIVRFADVLGLDLADVRTFLDEIPKVPVSAFDDLKDVDLSESASDNSLINSVNKFRLIKPDKILMILFQQPGGQPNFLDLVRENQVCLENAIVDDPTTLAIRGMIRVRNLDFHKSVYVRYTLDSWKTFADVQAIYVENSCDGFSDKFSFLIYAHTLSIGQRLEFACRFHCKGCQYWDNNRGVNYCFQCLPATHNAPISPITGLDDWGASFYY